jgi:hypothetical protein
MVVIPVAATEDMTPNLAGRDSFFCAFRSIQRLCGTAPGTTAADMCWPMSWPYFARVATLPDYQ